jgi:hypothetical protein
MADNHDKIYTPHEAAKKLGISVTMLRYMRLTDRIEGTSLGNTTVYTEEQINKADLTRKTPGPRKKNDSSSLMLVKNEKEVAAA